MVTDTTPVVLVSATAGELKETHSTNVSSNFFISLILFIMYWSGDTCDAHGIGTTNSARVAQVLLLEISTDAREKTESSAGVALFKTDEVRGVVIGLTKEWVAMPNSYQS
jgi:hypothetical protein